jgi:RNA recognition motif-containing protein
MYIGNLNYDITEEELQKIFEEYGEVTSVKIIKDKETGRAKGFGFVEMPEKEQANKALSELNGREVLGRNIKVSLARRKRTN